MPLTPAKCPECGGLVEVDSDKRAGLCQHCGQPFVIRANEMQKTGNFFDNGEMAIKRVYLD